MKVKVFLPFWAAVCVLSGGIAGEKTAGASDNGESAEKSVLGWSGCRMAVSEPGTVLRMRKCISKSQTTAAPVTTGPDIQRASVTPTYIALA